MYLAQLTIEGFRKIEQLDLTFRPGLNVLVGPNNIGKTAIIDALRALLSSTDEGSLRLDEYDLHIKQGNTRCSNILFKYVFSGLSDEEEADFLMALKPAPVSDNHKTTNYDAHISVRYTVADSGGRLRPKRWCGDHEENSVTSEILEDLRAVYLPPLRDPASGLRPSRTSQLARLLLRLSDEAARDEVVESLRKFDEELSSKAPVSNTQMAITERHKEMLGDVLKQVLKVGLTVPDFQRVAARLALSVENLDVEQNGLGYNNLIYMAVVLSELSLNPDAAYKALIIEEPEAHLHPQLQAVLLQYLQSKETPTEGEKAVQVFVTSHSPNFASIANIDTIGCIHQSSTSIKAFFPRDASFDPTKKAKLQRYLNVTRAELFFARRIVLVEGTSELFMIAALAHKLDIDLRKYSVSILSAEGLNFDAFLPLFGEDAMNVRVSIIMDSDPGGDIYPNLGDALILSPSAKGIKDSSNIYIRSFFALKTFEYDLALHEENHTAMLAALKEIHPSIAADLEKNILGCTNESRPKGLYCGMFERGATKQNVQKGAYAQALAHVVSAKEVNFKVPSYIEKALKYIIEE